MSQEAKEGIAGLLNMVEGCRAWPTHTLSNTIILMGKPTGGSRPIALMPMLYRLWSKTRKPAIQQWDKEECRGPWDAAVQGSSALRAAILAQFQDELHLLNGGKLQPSYGTWKIFMTPWTYVGSSKGPGLSLIHI